MSIASMTPLAGHHALVASWRALARSLGFEPGGRYEEWVPTPHSGGQR